MKKTQIIWCLIGLLMVWTMCPVAAGAQVSQKINFQGLLQDTQGDPVNETLNMTFSIYDVATGGTALWSETQSVTVTNGLYSVLLGETIPITLTAPAQYYLGIQVGANPEMTPRRELASVMSALFAGQVEGITVQDGKVGIGTITPQDRLDVAGNIHITSPDTGIYGLQLSRTDEDGRIHQWKWWHATQQYFSQNSLELWEYKTDSTGKTSCDGEGGDPADGAMCDPRITISEGGSMNLRIGPLTFDYYSNEGTVGTGYSDSGRIYGEHEEDTEISSLVMEIADNVDDEIVLRTVPVSSSGNPTLDMVKVRYDAVALAPDSGNVGVGTESPQTKLDVNGNIRITSPDTPNMYGLDLLRTDEEGRTHRWQWIHMSEVNEYTKNSLQLWETKTDSTGKDSCEGSGGDPEDGALCESYLNIREGGIIDLFTDLNIPYDYDISMTEGQFRFYSWDTEATTGIAYTDSASIYAEHDTGTDTSRFVLDIQDNTDDEIVLRTTPWTGSGLPTLDMVKVGYENVSLAPDSGLVGVGTDTPSANLHVSGSEFAIFQVTDSQTGNAMIIGTDPELPNYLRIRPTSGDGVAITNDSDAIGLFIDAVTGYAGMGTTTPEVKLDVAGHINVGNTGGNSTINFKAANDKTATIGVENDTDQGFYVSTGGQFRFSVNQNGNVGVGKNLAEATLDVNGETIFRSNIGFFGTEPTGTTFITDGFRVRYTNDFFDVDGDAMIFEKTDWNQVDPDGGVAFVNTGQDGVAETAFVIRGDGNVGVGTTQPSGKLSIDSPATDNSALYIEGDGVGVEWTRPFIRLRNNSATADKFVDFYVGDSGAAGDNTFLISHSNGTVEQFNFSIKDNGNVGIGVIDPSYKLHVNGSAAKPGGGSWDVASDARLKDVKGGFTSGLEAVARLQPVHYSYKQDNPLNLPSEQEYVGLVAQDVQQVIPEAVEEDEQGYLSVNNDPIIWAMLNAIKELKAENEALRREIEQLKIQIEE